MYRRQRPPVRNSRGKAHSVAAVVVMAAGMIYAGFVPPATSLAVAAATTDSAGVLKSLRVDMPCTAPMGATVGCKASEPLTSATMVNGEPGTQYDVTLRFRGVVEQKTYTGGTADGSWYVGGAGVTGDGFNSYWLTIQNPPQTYYLNGGSSLIFQSFPIDYTRTVRVAAGSIVALSADPGDSMEMRNIDANGAPIALPEVAPQPFDGQFVQMDVVAVSPVQATTRRISAR